MCKGSPLSKAPWIQTAHMAAPIGQHRLQFGQALDHGIVPQGSHAAEAPLQCAHQHRLPIDALLCNHLDAQEFVHHMTCGENRQKAELRR